MQVTTYNLHDPSMIRTLTGMVMLARNIDWQLFNSATPADLCQGVRLQFTLAGQIERRRALQILQEILHQHDIELLQRRGQFWRLNLDGLKEAVPDLLLGLDWARGVATVEPEIEPAPSGTGVPVNVLLFG